MATQQSAGCTGRGSTKTVPDGPPLAEAQHTVRSRMRMERRKTAAALHEAVWRPHSICVSTIRMDGGGWSRQSLEIPRTHLPDSPMARHRNGVWHTAFSNTCIRQATIRNLQETAYTASVWIWNSRDWMETDRTWLDSHAHHQPPGSATTALLGPPIHSTPTGIGPEKRYGFQLKMVGDEQVLPCMSNIGRVSYGQHNNKIPKGSDGCKNFDQSVVIIWCLS